MTDALVAGVPVEVWEHVMDVTARGTPPGVPFRGVVIISSTPATDNTWWIHPSWLVRDDPDGEFTIRSIQAP